MNRFRSTYIPTYCCRHRIFRSKCNCRGSTYRKGEQCFLRSTIPPPWLNVRLQTCLRGFNHRFLRCRKQVLAGSLRLINLGDRNSQPDQRNMSTVSRRNWCRPRNTAKTKILAQLTRRTTLRRIPLNRPGVDGNDEVVYVADEYRSAGSILSFSSAGQDQSKRLVRSQAQRCECISERTWWCCTQKLPTAVGFV